MNNHSDFKNASPRLKKAMLLDGYSYISEQLGKLAMELKVLNERTQSMADTKIKFGQGNLIDLRLLRAKVLDNSDLLTEQIVINAENVEKLINQITPKENGFTKN